MVHDKINETYVVFTILMRNDHTALVIGNQESQRFLQPPQTPTKPWRVGFLIKFYAAIQNCYTNLCKALIWSISLLLYEDVIKFLFPVNIFILIFDISFEKYWHFLNNYMIHHFFQNIINFSTVFTWKAVNFDFFRKIFFSTPWFRWNY